MPSDCALASRMVASASGTRTERRCVAVRLPAGAEGQNTDALWRAGKSGRHRRRASFEAPNEVARFGASLYLQAGLSR
jgi:hypothetical protein